MNRSTSFARGRVIVGLVGPGLARVEDRAVDAGHRDRHLEAEIRVLAELGVVQAAVERGVEQRAGRLDRHALADAIFAAGPAGVDQPAVDAALGDPLLEQVAVDRRVARHERRAEAGREGRLGLGHADLGAGDLGGVAGEEMVHRLVGRQPRDRRQHAERVGGQHDDVLRHRAHVLVRSSWG